VPSDSYFNSFCEAELLNLSECIVCEWFQERSVDPGLPVLVECVLSDTQGANGEQSKFLQVLQVHL
jgi:hypothetical protein